jgi:hypothetical protein
VGSGAEDPKPIRVGRDADASPPIRVRDADASQPIRVRDADPSTPSPVGPRKDGSQPIAIAAKADADALGRDDAKTIPVPPVPSRQRKSTGRSGATVPDGSGASTAKSGTTPPRTEVRFIDAKVAAALVDASDGVTAVPGRVARDPAARGHTQPVMMAPAAAEAPQRRTQPAVVPATVPTPAPVADVRPRPPAPRSSPAAAAVREAWRRVPNWAVAVAFALVGLSGGVLIASAWDDDEAATAETPTARLAGAAPTPAHDPPANPEPPPPAPVAPEPSVAPPIETTPADVPEIIAIVEDTPQDLDATEERPRRRARRRPRPAPVLDAPEPEPETEPEPPPPQPKPEPPSASALLRQARSAFANGDLGKAYRLARRSHSTSASDEALAVMSKAACRMGDQDSALAALRQLPLLDRAPIRRDCRRAGSRIGL